MFDASLWVTQQDTYKKQEKKGNSLLETKFMVMLSTNNLGLRWFRSHANVAQACSIVLSAHQVILPPRVSQEWSPGTPWGGFDPSHHPPLLFWAPPGTTPTTLQRVVDKTVFFSESGSWDNMVNLSTKSFPGAQFWLARERLGFMPRKNASPPVLSQRPFWPELI